MTRGVRFLAGVSAHAAPVMASQATALRRRRPRVAVGRVRHVVGLTGGAVLLALVVPSLAGVPWAAVVSVLASVPVVGLAVAVAVWLAGLSAHTVTLTASLPALTHRRALALSLTGSAVANVLPLGGAAGVAVNRRMTRAWGVPGEAFAAYTVVSNAWDVLAKVALGAVVLPVVVLGGGLSIGHLLLGAAVAAGGALVLVLVLVAALVSASTAALVGDAAERVVAVLLRTLGSARRPALRDALIGLQRRCSAVVRAGWGRLSLGMVLYTGLLFVLLWLCLHLTGAGVALPVVLAALTVERLLTMAGLTPGGAGVVEVGLTGVLLAGGGVAAAAVAGALLYRALTFGLEIPVGGANLAAWWWLQRRPGAAAVS